MCGFLAPFSDAVAEQEVEKEKELNYWKIVSHLSLDVLLLCPGLAQH